ncbi:Pex19 protein family-domain-containing protein [Mucor mucedo]|uniref:Pex19 protein family-domain-containing protein n=1 Tax=Mucor mucedo TaxID=29922 RepID=UPI00221F55E0|nr:Pex19 protein family-domain-containing protein [Mucor mucedo]KAI7896491.1 Pex19 protein family-domain-containing protein [Mucor mucedo]
MSKDLSNKNTQLQDDDSDFDDLLDDVLDDMVAPEPKAQQVQAKKETQSTAPIYDDDPAVPSLTDMLDSDDFAKQLAANMEQLMGQMGGADIGKPDDMNKAFEQVWASFDGNTAANTSVPTAAPSTREVPKVPQSFQDTIGQTMNKLKDSSKEIKTSINEESEDAFMAELMKQMESLADNGEFEGVLEGMMSQLMSKELLYEPMKDLSQKYPAWLKEHKDTADKADYEKYTQQHAICQQIVAKYEAPDFDEKNEVQGKKIMDLMTKMQDLGQPPAELLDEMAPGMNFGNPEGMPDMKDMENCNIM